MLCQLPAPQREYVLLSSPLWQVCKAQRDVLSTPRSSNNYARCVRRCEGESHIPYQKVSHYGTYSIVFNSSFQFHGHSWNQSLLPGPTLGASLLGVLLRSQERAVAISGNIKGLFHQVRMLPEHRPLLGGLWRDLNLNEPPAVFQWQVLPFGSTCSPCVETYALQRHVTDHSCPGDEIRIAAELSTTACTAQKRPGSLSATLESSWLVDSNYANGLAMYRLLSVTYPRRLGQAAWNWLAPDKFDPVQLTLGLSLHCQTDTLGFKHHPVSL